MEKYNHENSLWWDWIVPALVIAALAIAVWLHSREVQAHSWYPSECCHALDCGEVTATTTVLLTGETLPSLVVTTQHGTAVVPRNVRWRNSQDGRMHACIYQSEKGPTLRCIFAPPSL